MEYSVLVSIDLAKLSDCIQAFTLSLKDKDCVKHHKNFKTQ